MGDVQSVGRVMPVSEKTRRHRRRIFLLRVGGVLVLVLLAGFLVRVPRTVWAQGNVIAEEHAEVRPAVAGTVMQIRTHTGARVARDDVLVLLDNLEELSLLQEARLQSQKAAAEYARRSAEIEEHKRQWQEAQVVVELRLRNAQSRRQRTGELMERGLAAGSALEDAQLEVDLIQAELESLRKRDLDLYEKELDVIREELASREESVVRAEAAVRAREVRAPIDGQVLRYDFVEGELVRPDMVLLEIFGGERLMLKLRIPERYATRVAVGDRYRARLASFRGLRGEWFTGELKMLRHVIQYEGALGYRVAYCDFDAGGRMVPPGATAEAKIYCGRTRLWFSLLGLD